MTITAFIPARSGSKRLTDKNIKPLAGKPLILWTLEASIQSSKVDRVIFSTDSIEYWNIAKEFFKNEKLTLDLRSPEEAGDNIKIFDYLVTSKDKIFSSEDETFVLTLPTVPFRTTNHINSAIDQFNETKHPIFSATEFGFPISFAFHIENEKNWAPLSEQSPMLTGNTRSQDQRTAYHPNGAIYIRSVKDLMNPSLNTLYQDAIPFIMDRTASIDIDNEVDFIIASAIVEANMAV